MRSTPSTRPRPARRMGTTTNFLPASVGASISQMGVSMCLVVSGQVAGGLVGDEHTDLGHQLAEILDAGVLVAHDGQLVRHQGMVHDVHLLAVHVMLILRIYKF